MTPAALRPVPSRPIGVRLCDVKPEPVSWLWPSRVPMGKFALLDGDPGLGKTLVTLDLAARVSRGLPLPDGAPTAPAGVVLMTAEDGLGDTIRPRLEAAGADLSRVLAVEYVPEANGGDHPPELPNDLPALEDAVGEVGAALVIIDPLVAYLAGATNANRDADVRRALAPLAALASRLGVAIVGVRHLNKTALGNPLYRGGGSIAFIGAARAGLLVSKDPDDDSRRVLAMTKSNLAPMARALSFTIDGASGVPRVRWLGSSNHTAAGLLAAAAGDSDERSVMAEAVEFLRSALAGGPVPVNEIVRQARQLAVSERTLKRARAALHVHSRKLSGIGGGWVLELPAGREPGEDDDAL